MRVFLCPICSLIYLYCSPVRTCCHLNDIFNIAIKSGGVASHKTRFNPPFLLTMSWTRSGNNHCYIIVRFCVCVLYFSVVFLLCRSSPVIFDIFPSVIVCDQDFFFLNRFMNLEQRYTTVAFIHGIVFIFNISFVVDWQDLYRVHFCWQN